MKRMAFFICWQGGETSHLSYPSLIYLRGETLLRACLGCNITQPPFSKHVCGRLDPVETEPRRVLVVPPLSTFILSPLSRDPSVASITHGLKPSQRWPRVDGGRWVFVCGRFSLKTGLSVSWKVVSVCETWCLVSWTPGLCEAGGGVMLSCSEHHPSTDSPHPFESFFPLSFS